MATSSLGGGQFGLICTVSLPFCRPVSSLCSRALLQQSISAASIYYRDAGLCVWNVCRNPG